MRTLLWTLTLVGLVCPVAAATRPNILLIVSEDNGPELGCYGDPYARTPNLDRLAAEGVRFSRAYVAQAGCSQSRAAFLTGLYPHQNGQINPGYGFTVDKKMADAKVAAAIGSAAPAVRDAYRRMKRPPRFELYDLKNDPYEFSNLSGQPIHARKLAELKAQLAAWRKRTGDPLLNPATLQRLKTEVESIRSKKAGKKHDWAYPSYLFDDIREDPLEKTKNKVR